MAGAPPPVAARCIRIGAAAGYAGGRRAAGELRMTRRR